MENRLMHIEIPQKVQEIIKGLESKGFEAFAVGGCVRDALLGRTPQDWDITTNALPEQIKAVFPRTVDTGIQHGTVTVLSRGEAFEVTTYRIDGAYSDARHPDQVSFTSRLKDDLSRRDFTINAMAYNGRAGLVDVFGGLSDLREGLIRCVGDANTRYSEDALRMMRALRFAATLGFEIEERSYAAIGENAQLLRKISAERIFSELTKTVISDHPEKLYEMYETGLTGVFMPEFDVLMRCEQHTRHHIYTVGVHTIEVMKGVHPDRTLRFAALFHDFGKPVCRTTDDSGNDHFHGHPAVSRELSRQILRRLKSDHDLIREVGRLVEWHDVRTEPQKKQVRRLMARIGSENIPQLLELQRADVMAQSDYKRLEKLARIDAVEALYGEITKDAEAVSLKELAISGKDLIAAGIQDGPAIGRILRMLLEQVLDDPAKNSRETLLAMAEEQREEEEQHVSET